MASGGLGWPLMASDGLLLARVMASDCVADWHLMTYRAAQAAHEFFRQSLRDALAVHFEGGSEADQQADQQGAEGRRDITQTPAMALLAALGRAYEEHENHLRQRFDRLQKRHWAVLDRAKQDAAHALTMARRSSKGGGKGGGKGGRADAGALADELSVRNGDEAAALAGWMGRARRRPSDEAADGASAEEVERSAASAEEAALSSLQAEGRAVLQSYIEEAAQLRTERGALRGELQTAAVAAKVASVGAPLIAC